MTMDVTLVAGPPEIHGGGGTNFKWIVPINLRGLVRSTPTPKGADKTAPFFFGLQPGNLSNRGEEPSAGRSPAAQAAHRE